MEWRQKYTFFGVLLYVGATVFAVYMMNGQPSAKVWNALFWITQLFVAVNAVSKSFLQEHPTRFRYYFTIVTPVNFFIAKVIYSIIMMLSMSVVSLALFTLLLGNPLLHALQFVAVMVIGSTSISVIFALLSAVASRANQNAALMAILGFPLITPLLMLVSNLALRTVSPVYQSGWWDMVLILSSLDILVIVLGIILFPLLWQE